MTSLNGSTCRRMFFFTVFACLSFAFVSLPAAAAAPLKIIAGTSNLADAVRRVAGETVTIGTIIPGGACPGHYDVRPGDITFLADADALLLHPWQQEYSSVQTVVNAAENPKEITRLVTVKGNWMLPDVQIQAIRAISTILRELNPVDAEQYETRAQASITSIKATAEAARTKLRQVTVEQKNVLCAEMQQSFIAWAGFKIVGTYGRPEELTPTDMAALLTKAREAGVSLLVDNLQSGKDAGKSMARELGAAQLTLSNFVDGFPETETWEKTLMKNIDILIDAISH